MITAYLIVIVLTIARDFICAKYTLAIVRQQRLKAALLSGLWHLLNGLSIVTVFEEHSAVFAMAFGGVLGVYAAVDVEKKSNSKPAGSVVQIEQSDEVEYRRSLHKTRKR